MVKLVALSSRSTIVLAFAREVARGHLHTLLDESGGRAGVGIAEQDVEDYADHFHNVITNLIVELVIRRR